MSGEEESSPAMSTVIVLSDSVGQRGTGDEFGNNVTFGEVTGDISGDPFTEFILYGIPNGSFPVGPPQGVGSAIGPDNLMPYMTGPVIVSGGGMEWSWVEDAASPSTYNLRCEVPPGAVDDETYMQWIVPIGGSRSRVHLDYVRVWAIAGAANLDFFDATSACQYLDADGVATGAEVDGSLTLNPGDEFPLAGLAATGRAPANARSLRIRIGAARGAAAAGASGTIDFSDVRRDPSKGAILFGDQFTGYDPGRLLQTSGVVTLAPILGSTPTLTLDSVTDDATITLPDNDDFFRVAGGHLQLAEIVAPATPASGYLALYADTSGVFHSLNDGGTDVALSTGAALGLDAVIKSPAATQTIITSDAAAIPLVLRGAASQSADIFEAENSTGQPLLRISPVGLVTQDSTGGWLSTMYSNTAFGNGFLFRKSRSGTIGTNTVVQSGDRMGYIGWSGYGGSAYDDAAYITGEVDGTPGVSDMPGRILFFTSADGSAVPTERLRISSTGAITIAEAGNIILGTTTGTKIGTATSQKLGFFNATPIIQPAAAAQAAAPAGGTGATAGAYDTAANRDAMIATVNAIRTALVNLGLMKGAA